MCKNGEIGAITATGGPAVGALVLHGASHHGAIATQAMTNPMAGITGVEFLREAMPAKTCLDVLLKKIPPHIKAIDHY